MLVGGCVDVFSGSNIQLDFSPAMPSQVPAGQTASATQIPTNAHFTFYAFQSDTMAGRLFAIQDFEIHRVVDPTSPCFIELGNEVTYPGLHSTMYEKKIDEDTGIPDYKNPPATASMKDKELAATAAARMQNITALASDTGLNAVTSASTAEYPTADTGCTDTSKIPAPTCTDDASNKRRLEMCQAFWAANPGFYEGTDLSLTVPLAGTNYGFVQGANPLNSAPVGGTQFFVDEALGDFGAFAVYWQFDDANGDGMPDYPMNFPDKATAGQLLLFGQTSMPTRGVMHATLTNASDPNFNAELAIFANLDQDSTHF